MKRIPAILVLLFSSLVLLTAMNQSFMNRIKQDRYFDHQTADNVERGSFYYRTFVRSDRWRFGDLYGLCYLPQYKHRLEPFPKYRHVQRASTKRTLYIIGDSFLADKTLTGAFDKYDNVIYLDRRFPYGPIYPDTTKENDVLLEFAERNLSEYNFNNGPETQWPATERSRQASNADRHPSQPVSLLKRMGNILFNKDLSRNLELLMFDDRAFTPVKELKASLNYKLFGRMPPEVTISADKKRLLLNLTVDTSSTGSSFRPKTQEDVNRITGQLDIAGSYYQRLGFKNVLLSIIPNAASIYDSGRMPYNHLLERVEKQTRLRTISVYEDYKTDKSNLFFISDAHWNPEGFKCWVNKANAYFNGNLK
jgi:hypothetical protein